MPVTPCRACHCDRRPQLGSFSTPLKDGWGITAAGKLLVLSDGSDKLTWVDPAKGFATVRSVTVKDGDRPVPYLNEVRGAAASNCVGQQQQQQLHCGSSSILRQQGS